MDTPEPFIGEPAKTRKPSEVVSARTDAIRLLIIDDDRPIGRMIETLLSKLGFLIDIVFDPNLIEQQLRKHEYHLIILDYVLPGVEPAQVMKWIQTYQANAGIIVVTAYPSMDGALHCLRAHTFDYLTKPFSVEGLRSSVLRCLESRGLVRLPEQAFLEKLGTIIRNRRKDLGLTLAEAAERSNVSVGYLSQIELGKSSARIEMLYRIALGLQIQLVDLFQSVQSSEGEDDKVKR